MKLKAIYLKAAKTVSEYDIACSCTAVHFVYRWKHPQIKTDPYTFYAYTMHNKQPWLTVGDIYEAVDIPWKLDLTKDEKAKIRNFRMLLLCMMAAACEDL